MASTDHDLRRNLDAVTHFLDVVNAPKGQEASGSAALDEGASAAAVAILRQLNQTEEAPLDDLASDAEASFLERSEALTRLLKAGLIEARKLEDGREAVALTADGRRLSTVVEQAPLAR